MCASRSKHLATKPTYWVAFEEVPKQWQRVFGRRRGINPHQPFKLLEFMCLKHASLLATLSFAHYVVESLFVMIWVFFVDYRSRGMLQLWHPNCIWLCVWHHMQSPRCFYKLPTLGGSQQLWANNKSLYSTKHVRRTRAPNKCKVAIVGLGGTFYRP